MTSVVPLNGYTSPDPRVLLVDDDVERLHAAIGKYFASPALRVIQNHPICGRFQICHQGELSLYVVGYGADAELGPSEVLDSYIVNLPLAGNGMVVVDRQEVLSAPSVVSPGQRFRARKCADGTSLVVVIARDTVDKAVRDVLGEAPSTSVRFAVPINPRDDDAVQWMALVRAVAGAADGGLLALSPLAAGHSEQLLVHGLLGFQPHSRSTAFAGSARPATPASLRRAMTFCEENAGQPISVVDLAAAARVSVRTLQDSFRTYAQITPLGYLRRVRLERAHRDLLAAAESGEPTTVTDVALRWGFVHLSRFAQLYRNTYGHLPSESLSSQRGTCRALSG